MRKLLLLTCLLASPAMAQQPDPSASYRTITTEHFRVTYTQQLAHLAQPAAERAEEAYAVLRRELTDPPKGRIDLLLSDESDAANGYATPFFSNRVVIFVKPPIEDIELQYFNEWFDLVITHELAHIFHLDSTGSVGRVLRTIFGRLPLAWPFFPVIGMPGWNIEGLAVEMESRGTGFGRQHGSYHEMVVRTAILEGAFDPIDRVSGNTPIWPGGQRDYIYGSLFNDFVARKYGARAQHEITRKTAGSVLPPVIAANHIGKRALGTSFTDAYEAWEAELQQRYQPLRDSLVRLGLTPSERLTAEGRYALYPRVSPTGSRLSYAEEIGRDVTMTRVIELPSGRTLWRERRNGRAPAPFADDNTLLTSQYEFADPYALRSDLYVFRDGEQTRLTRAARIEEPDLDRSRGRIVAIELGQGSNRIVQLDREGNFVRAITNNTYGVGWAQPRWSPSGDRIAVTRWQQGGRHDVVVIDTTGRVVEQLTDDAAIDAAPVWSPDGRYILFTSDRTGITNLYAYDVQSRALRQVSNVLTGVFYPEITPDGRTIYFSAYHADGYHIERMAFDPASWRAPMPAHLASAQRPRLNLDSAAAVTAQPNASAPRGYSAFKTLRPYFWVPWGSTGDIMGDFWGIATAGADLVERHSYSVGIARAFSEKRDEGYLYYTFAGAGNPLINARFERDWDELGQAFLLRRRPADPDTSARDTSLVELLEREDNAELSATFVSRRIRSSLSFTIGGELVRRRLTVADTPNVPFRDAVDLSFGPIARIGFANYRTPAFAISREDGLSLSATARWRHEVAQDTSMGPNAGYKEVTTWNTAYKSLGRATFAHHVIGLRFSALWRDGDNPPFTRIGGAPGDLFDLGIASIGDDAGLLPVRGYDDERRGTKAWTASFEYRLPIVMVGRGIKLWPVFLDRLYLSAFADAGKASCPENFTSRLCMPREADPLFSVGGELGFDFALFSFANSRARVGFGQPLTNGDSGRLYLSFGSAF